MAVWYSNFAPDFKKHAIMELKKVLLSTLAMAAFFIGALALFMFVACSTPAPQSETQPQEQPAVSEIVYDTVEVVGEPDVPASQESRSSVKSASHSDIPTSSSSSYSDYSSSDEETDCWTEKRKHSPNDNYLLGFDDDVDDVHDMEIYMEDY